MEFENELNTGVESEASPEPQTESSEPAAEVSTSAEQEQSQQSDTPTQEKQAPFNNHPRFKELIDQKNEYANQVKQMQAQYAEMERRFKALESHRQPAQPKAEDPLIARLKGIDPEFGSEFGNLKETLQQFQTWQKAQDNERVRSQAYGTIDRLHEENKVAPEWRDIYKEQIEAAVLRNPKLELEDLPNLYKDVHAKFSKQIDDIRRAERESYVAAKKTDAKMPNSISKGKAVTPGGEPQWSKDPTEARAQLIKRVLKMSKASDSV